MRAGSDPFVQAHRLTARRRRRGLTPRRRPQPRHHAFCKSRRPEHGSPTTTGAAPITTRASPGRTATSVRRAYRCCGRFRAGLRCCRKARRGSRCASRREWAPRCAIRTWSGPTPTATRRNTPRPAGPATTAISSAGRRLPATPSTSARCTTFTPTRRFSIATTPWCSSAMTNTGQRKCVTRSMVMSKRGGKVARFAGNFLWQTRIEDGGTDAGLLQVPLPRRPAVRNGRNSN